MTIFGAIVTTLQFDSDFVTHLSKRSLRPVVYTGERIAGRLFVHSETDQQRPFDASQITLTGKVKNSIKYGQKPVRIIEKPLIHMSCINSCDDFYPGRTTSTHQTSFFFDIPYVTTLPESLIHQELYTPKVAELPESLPPTINIIPSHSIAPGEIEVTCQVMYTIEARLLLNGQTISKTLREIVILPTAVIPPPLELKHCGSEYKLSDSSSLRHFWAWEKTSRIKVFCSEPQPFFVQPPGNPAVASTELQFRFLLHPGSEASLTLPDMRECKATLSLEAITYYCAKEQNVRLSLAEIRSSVDSLARKALISVEKRKLILGPWEYIEGVWEMRTSITTIGPERLRSLPSFLSTLVSRRFAFVVELELRDRDGTSQLSHNLMLRVPVQVVLAPMKPSVSNFSSQSVDELIDSPLYVEQA